MVELINSKLWNNIYVETVDTIFDNKSYPTEYKVDKNGDLRISMQKLYYPQHSEIFKAVQENKNTKYINYLKSKYEEVKDIYNGWLVVTLNKNGFDGEFYEGYFEPSMGVREPLYFMLYDDKPINNNGELYYTIPAKKGLPLMDGIKDALNFCEAVNKLSGRFHIDKYTVYHFYDWVLDRLGFTVYTNEIYKGTLAGEPIEVSIKK